MSEIIQKATEWGKQSKKFAAQWRSLEDCVAHGRYVWQPKYDGVHAIIDTTERRAYTREQTPLPSIQHVVDYLCGAIGPGHVFQGEVWNAGVAFNDTSGAARRHAVQPHLGVVLYDWHERGAFLSGVDTTPYTLRYGQLGRELAKVSGWPNIMRAVSCSAEEAPIGGWQVLAQEYVQGGGYDGLILRNADAGWVAGPCRLGELIKVKPSVTLDLRVSAIITEKGAKTGRDVFKIAVDFRGAPRIVGSGVPHAAAELPTVGQIVEVECMCINTNGTLREPRFKGIRWDKLRSTDEVDA